MTSVVRRQDHDSGDYSDASHQEIEPDITNDGAQPESDYESQGSDSDRSDREPEVQETERRVDDDEDRSNPQYIPKKGTFYEHDDRTAASGEESANTTSETTSDKKEGSETPSERRRPPRKSETINKWSHDKYNENEQVPKSRDELVAIYGYDIRNEDAPPHARRNRRYGRGPNKYTRTWEDEEAYKRQAQAAQQTPRKPPNPEDFPELDASARTRQKRAPRPRSKSQPSSNDSVDSGSALRRNASVKSPRGRPSPRAVPSRGVYTARREAKENLPALENLTITATVFNNNQGAPQRKVNAFVAQQRPVPTDQGKRRPPPQAQPQPQNNSAPNKSPPRQQNAPQQQQRPQQQQSQPSQQQQQAAAGAESRGGSKRYSSLRQRPLDTYSPQPVQQQNQNQQQQQPLQQPLQQGQHRYHAEFPGAAPPSQHQGSPGPQLHPQQMLQQLHRANAVSQPAHGPSPPHQALPQLTPQQITPQQLAQQQITPQQLTQQQITPQQLAQQQHTPQQLAQQQITPQQLSQQQITPQQLAQQQITPQQLAQQQITPQQLSQQQLTPQQLAQQQLTPQQLAQQQLTPQQHSQQHAQQVRLGMLDQQQLVSHQHHSMHNLPPQPHNIGQLQSTQGYVPPAMMPAQYMQQSGSGAVFSAAPMYAQPPAPYPHQMYPHHNYAPPAAVTYYTCPEQEQPPRAQRRSAAIPIVRPAAPAQPDRPANADIDRIVENMFVRKPWPATQDAPKENQKQPETRNSQEPASKESSQPNSLTSSSISTDSRPSDSKEEKEELKEERKADEAIVKEESKVSAEDSIPDA